MPSVNSSSSPKVWPSSTLTTPSLPTFSIASAITSPISRSRDEMLATRAMSSLPEISFDCDFRSSTTASTAVSMPRLRPIGFAPAATFFRPSRTIACASTVAVVVPSPATSFVAVATSRTSWAPWFSKTSSTSISRAIVTPSFVMVGAPNFLSSTTYRPLGPRVTLTASARTFTPRSRARRASSLNRISLCAIQLSSVGFPAGALSGCACHLLLLRALLGGRDDLGEDVGLAQDQIVVAAEPDLGATVLRVDHFVALDDVHRDVVAALVPRTGADSEHTTALGLLLRGVRQDDSARGGLFLLEGLDDQPITQWLQVHSAFLLALQRLTVRTWHSPLGSARAHASATRGAGSRTFWHSHAPSASKAEAPEGRKAER